MRIIVVDNYEEMSKRAALMITSQVTLKPDSVLGLATGDTPLGMYEELVKLYNKKEVDFKEVRTFNLDEYYGLDPENPQSYYSFMNKNLFDKVDISKNNINMPDGMVKDVNDFCLLYENKIKTLGGIDMQVLGIGGNGHIGFNEPNVNFEAQTHLVNLNEQTIEANSRFFKSIEDVPVKAISMGIKTIMNSKKIILLANGLNKAEAIAKAVNGKINPSIPASILQLHNDVTIIIDKEAASLL
ncbi:glucosamine-6-phosphate deaminase [Clostridium estertheticum]|uniref:Glucosamine-6-phosphate deaminase n=2 Tax=Clostridium estertheticum TaxID=238834 RepID=A0A1J0GKF1_9CLOT|nr:glucosamine-6-phosphate deaminase [Clostridium estertheticum]APC41817.1 glucosamine-6-phosphate deaminase [Clostridium estertheticum subsp. estertheticum]MBU3073341.1 glucosamine-6-phosphate deaminase [Clostridium estertheticum]MBU3163418.1 glucosamine-6-phosphate deaminase [Clostridium estertheticum]MBZ9616291.1 glucosamine-6-phosphate deaminase [Clostridium estertheticum subsp. laramiense]MPQ33143.1 glucosamine-6-phosphate deaminase [Clostridium estertheticum]